MTTHDRTTWTTTPWTTAGEPVSTDQRSASWRGTWSTIAWVTTILTLGYMLPWAIATTRGARNSWGVFWVTLLTGWTIIGWVAALVMAVQPHR